MNIKNWLKSIFCSEVGDLYTIIDGLEVSLKNCSETNNKLNNEIIEFKKLIPSQNPKEKELNEKYPTKTINYTGRYIPNFGKLSIDVRDFFINPVASELTDIVTALKMENMSDDEKALTIQKWIVKQVTYTSDKTLFGMDEYWCYPQELLLTRKGDCDDGAILMGNLMIAAGLPYWKIRITAGDTDAGGHAYLTYYCEERDKWVTMDWCYFQDSHIPVKDKPDYKDSILYGEVWFSFSSKYAFSRGTKSGT